MRTKRVLRYYCDHCRKGSCGKAAMIKHEAHCTLNPDRSCNMCRLGKLEPLSASLLGDLFDEGGLSSLEFYAEGCPACMLAGIRQSKAWAARCAWMPDEDEGRPDSPPWAEFDFKKRAKEWLDNCADAIEQDMAREHMSPHF